MMSCHTPEINKQLTGSNTPEVNKQPTGNNITNKLLEEKLIVNKRLLETRGRVCYTPPTIPAKFSKKFLLETREQVSLPNSTIKINCPTPPEVNKQLTGSNITKLEDKLIVNKKLLETRGERACYTPPTLSAKFSCHTPEVNKQLTGSNVMVETREQVSLPNSTIKVKGLMDEVYDTSKRLEILQQNVQERLGVLNKQNSVASGNGSGNIGSKQSTEQYQSQQQNKEVLNKIEANYQEMLAKINALSLDTKNAMKKF